MRLLLLALLVALPASGAALSDNLDFTEAFYVRAAVGDIPGTGPTEAAGVWNVAQYARLTQTADFTLPPTALFDGVGCTCSNMTTRPGAPGHIVVTVDGAEPSGSPVVVLRTHQPAGIAFSFSVPQAPVGGDASYNFYVPAGSAVYSNLVPAVAGLPSTSDHPGLAIYQYHASISPDLASAWFAVHPSVAVPAPPAPWPYAALGAVLGALAWAILVRFGWVQRRQRRQVAATPTHLESAHEPAPVLEARRRFLMETLTSIEVARQNEQLDPAVYDAVKADFKRQAVTAMRALEEAKMGASGRHARMPPCKFRAR
ncbi:MAG: hypothetical protein ACYDBQ_07290 [Thermoplasmatota archaeon]